MPYITKERRVDLDNAIDILVYNLIYGKYARAEDIAGDLNYTITRLVEVVPRVQGGKWRYRLCNLVIGMLDCCSKEFYRRLVAPYEDKAIEKNGDIPYYEN